MQRLKLAVVAVIALSLGGCIATNLGRYNRIDATDKTIFIPFDESPLITGLEQELAADGWTVNPPVPTTAALPRYRLEIRQMRVDPDRCDDPSGDPVVKFFLILYDTRTSDAALIFRGRDCSHSAVAEFMDAARRFVQRPRRDLDDGKG